MPTSTTIRGLAGLALAVGLGCATTAAGPPTIAGPARSDVEALIGDLQGEVDELDTMGMDTSRLEQHARMARVMLADGDTAHAEELAAQGLELADAVRGHVDEIIEAELAEKDREIRIELANLEDYLREGGEAGVALKLSQIETMVAHRNERASHTKGRFPEVTYAKQLDPIRKAAKDISQSQVRSEFTSYKESLGRPLAKLRGNELPVLQEAMHYHVDDNAYKAKRAYLAALRLEPDNYKALQNLGILEMELGEYPAAADRLGKAFSIGLTLDEKDGEWFQDFAPDPEPLIAALREVGQTASIPGVRARYEARVAQVEAMREEREQARVAALAAPEEAVAEETQDASASDDEKCRQKPVAGKVQMIADGMDMETVREIICAPDSLKLVENKAYWYYQTGTVVFEDEKVIETSQGRVEPGAQAPAQP